jgi:hypothetical protein
MKIAESIPGLDDTALTNLYNNARRLGASAAARQQKQATILIPLLEAELAARKAAKAKSAHGTKKKSAKAVEDQAV